MLYVIPSQDLVNIRIVLSLLLPALGNVLDHELNYLPELVDAFG